MSQVVVNFLVAWLAGCGLLALAALVQDWRARRDRALDPVALVLLRSLLIGAALLASPLYWLWLRGGRLADRRGQRRR
jgi:hypothetical protein